MEAIFLLQVCHWHCMRHYGHLMDGTVQQLTNFQFHSISYRNTLNYGTEEAHDVNKYVYYIIYVTI